MYRVIHCTCGWQGCQKYQVTGVAPEAKFTLEEAVAVAEALNRLQGIRPLEGLNT